MKNISGALLISTYNWPEALNLLLKSIALQEVMPNEILIADDGSKPATKDLIDSYRDKINAPIKHVWHEDNGFRKTIILNKALAKCTSDYIMQVDGDCILHPKFVKDQKEFAQQGFYLYGTRVHLKIKHVQRILEEEKATFSFFNTVLKKRARRLRIPFLAYKAKPHDSVSPKLRGCNMSFWRSDILKINGFNESIQGWGRSDSELAIRLHNIGVKAKRIKFMGFVYHLDHIETDKSRVDMNIGVENKTIKDKIVWAENGLDKYL